jgi:O-antigen ligase
MAGAAVSSFGLVLLGAIVWGTLAFGAVYPWAYWPLAAVCAGLGGVGLANSRAWREGRLRTIVWLLGGVAVAIALQLVPLPVAMFRAVEPNGDRFLANYDLQYRFEPPAWHATSLAPAQTAVALALFVALALLLVGLTVTVARWPLRPFVTALALFGIAVSVIGVVDRVATPPNETHYAIYGFWHTEEGGHPFAPFVNPNHYAGWMLLVIAPTLGYAAGLIEESWTACDRHVGRWVVWLTRPEAGRLAVMALSLATMMTALILTGSRSGVTALAAVLGVLAVCAVVQAGSGWSKVGSALVVGGVFALALGWAGTGPILAKFTRAVGDSSTAGRASIWQDALRIFRDFPVLGSGLGSFGRLMLVYQSGNRAVYFTEAHNDYLQVLAEGGVVVAAAVVVCLAVLAATIVRRLRQDTDPVTGWIRLGAMAGILGIAAQSLVEFSLQMPAVAVLFVVLLAIAIHRPSDRVSYAHRL